jgi:hypothetical protein
MMQAVATYVKYVASFQSSYAYCQGFIRVSIFAGLGTIKFRFHDNGVYRGEWKAQFLGDA